MTTLRRPDLGSTPDPLDLSFPAMPDRLADVRRRLREWLLRCGIDSDRAYDIVLAVSEACSNSVEHGYRGEGGLVRLHASASATDLRITVTDRGSWKPRDTPSDPWRGRGLELIRALVPGASLTPGPDGTEVEFRIPIAVQPPPATV
ncbi:ATP-binding protein [Nocardia sp. CDC159]|uniref:ATP-binding protein n=1 Tax=Nocardia pulmonis TaxID=2951408 RepID=A0A9X2E5R9_9NOCA|nr:MULTISPECIES: ATP-binding protein [Nocardia]MCM6774170.1 ATP-binding protein [Nocardia pulmonis]MCM6787057.1 ATP-binding protein [Nocardia sp. CDC159]